MADKIALLLEAERRGILPPEKVALLAEARKRGLVPGGQKAGVTATTDTTANVERGPLVPSPTARMQPAAPSLESVNAANRAAMAAPGFREREQAATLARRQDAFQRAPMPVRVLAGSGAAVGNLAMGAGQLAGLTDEADVTSMRERNRNMEGDLAAGAGRIATEAGLFAVPMSKVGNLSRAGQYATNAGVGAAIGAAQPVVDGESRGMNAALGGGLGLLGQGLSDGVMAVGKRAAGAISPQLRELASYGESIGLPLTGADLMKSEAGKRIASMMDALPFSGASARQEARSGAIGKQVAKLIGQDADDLNQGVMRRAYEDLGKQYDDFFKDGMQVDRAFIDQLDQAREFATGNLDDAAIRATGNFVDRVKAQLQDGGRISGETLQSLDQQARKLATGGGDRQQAMQELRSALHDAFGRQSGQSQAWRDLNRKYANYKTIEPLIARNPEGIAPEQLLQAVNANKAGKARMARGQAGEIGDLALLGRQMRPPRTSKTPEGLLNLALGAGSALAPAVTIPLGLLGIGAGRILNSPAAGRVLLREGRGQGAQALAPYLRGGTFGLLGPLSDEEADDPRKRP